MLNQQVRVHSRNAQARWNRQRHGQCSINGFTYILKWASEMECQRCGQCSINKFTYLLEMWKWGGVVRGAVSAQSTVHILPGDVQVRRNHKRHSQCSINRFTYGLEMYKRDRIVRGAVSVQSTSARTYWKYASEMELSEVQSVLSKQVHLHTGNAQGRKNCQRRSQSSINKVTYFLEMRE